MDTAAILTALDRWEAAACEISGAVDHLSLDGRRTLIALRTQASVRFAELGAAIDAAIAGGGGGTLLEARERRAALRRAIGIHQARWPVVIIADDMAAYAAESRKLRRERDAFAVWLRHQTTAQTVFHSR